MTKLRPENTNFKIFKKPESKKKSKCINTGSQTWDHDNFIHNMNDFDQNDCALLFVCVNMPV